jgi:hypothetical protein
MFRSVRPGRRAAFVALGAAVATLAPMTAALAGPPFDTTTPAKGSSNVTISKGILKAFQAGPCGTFDATGFNGTTATFGAKGLKIISPVYQIETSSTDPSLLRIDHLGGVTLDNACYTVTLQRLRIQNNGQTCDPFGNCVPTDQTDEFDLNALSKGSGRSIVGTLDLSNSNVVVKPNGHTSIYDMVFNLAQTGADDLNQLYNGTTTGPFYAGETAGHAKTRFTPQ